MILSKFSNIKLNGSNISYFKDKGYYGKLHQTIEVKVEDLKKNSQSKILVKCDICGKEKILMYQSYNMNIDKYNYYSCSRKCAQDKIERTCIEKYGCKNPFQNEEIKEKIKDTLINKYKVEHPMLSDDIKEKLKSTNLERYGCEWVFNNDDIKEKIFETMIQKYGCKYAHQNEDSLIKFLDSCDFEKGF